MDLGKNEGGMKIGNESGNGGAQEANVDLASFPNFSLREQFVWSGVDELLEGEELSFTANRKGSRKSLRFPKLEASMADSENPENGGPFVCDMCGRQYAHHRSLRDHKKYHAGATRCPVCNRAFSKVANMRAHFSAQHAG